MRNDSLQHYINLRRELSQERDQLSQRLGQINEALGELSAVAPASAPSSAEPEPSPAQPRTASRGRGRTAGSGGMSLREHVLQVLRGGAKTKEEVLRAVQQGGYRFQTKDPLNSLGVILYGKNPKFNRVDGKFSLIGGVSGGNRNAGGGWSGNGKRTMSPAARARIAEAQRQRWAATRKAQPATTKASPQGGMVSSGKRKMSPAARKAIAEAARKRWAAAKRAGKNRL
jgi:hypothetical protein